MQTIIISIGDELILGQTIDTNAAWLSEQLSLIGLAVSEHITVGDNEDNIIGRLTYALDIADIIIVTGGLGPTIDDLTRFAIAKTLDCPLLHNAESMAHIESFFQRLGRSMATSNSIQAMFPQASEPIANAKGTADGIFAKVKDKLLFSLPGVPMEMKAMYENFVRDKIQESIGKNNNTILCRKLNAFGTGESNIGQAIADLMTRNNNPTVNTTAAHSIISIRINALAENPQQAENMLDKAEQEIRNRLGEYIFGVNEQSLAEVVVNDLRKNGLTLATAESCTGGLLAEQLTDIPGVSKCFKSGFIVYSNDAKIELLGVDKNIIEEFGAVSEPVARALAKNVRIKANSDFGIGITGIAGPGGATADKPLGMVYIALASKDQTEITRNIFTGNRKNVRLRACYTALDMLLKKLKR